MTLRTQGTVIPAHMVAQRNGTPQPRLPLASVSKQDRGEENRHTNPISDLLGHRIDNHDDRQCTRHQQARNTPKPAEVPDHLSENRTRLVPRRHTLSKRSPPPRIDRHNILNHIENSRIHRLPLRRGADAERRFPPEMIIQAHQEHRASGAEENGGAWHAQHAQKDIMRRRSDDEYGCHHRDAEHDDPIRDVERPALIHAQRLVEPLLPDQAQTPDRELDVRRPTPNRCDDGKHNEALDMATEGHGVVQKDRDDTRIEDHQGDIATEPPSFEAVAECEGQLGEELGVFVVICLQRAGASLVLGLRCGSRVVEGITLLAICRTPAMFEGYSSVVHG